MILFICQIAYCEIFIERWIYMNYKMHLTPEEEDILNGGKGETMPLRYNNDKQKKPLFSRGLSVCRLLFNSFSKLKIDENYKEKRRLFY